MKTDLSPIEPISPGLVAFSRTRVLLFSKLVREWRGPLVPLARFPPASTNGVLMCPIYSRWLVCTMDTLDDKH
jgi:hypothetical protein